jgi:uncharacterized protein (DUF433 family)
MSNNTGDTQQDPHMTVDNITTDLNNGQPSVPSGYTVLQIVKLREADYTASEVSERLDIPLNQVDDALEYADKNPDKVEEERKRQERIAEEHGKSHP